MPDSSTSWPRGRDRRPFGEFRGSLPGEHDPGLATSDVEEVVLAQPLEQRRVGRRLARGLRFQARMASARIAALPRLQTLYGIWVKPGEVERPA